MKDTRGKGKGNMKEDIGREKVYEKKETEKERKRRKRRERIGERDEKGM